MESFEVLNESRNKNGIIVARETIHEKGYYHAAVMVFALDEDNRVLLQKRSEQKDSNPEMWDVSCAGHVAIDEKYEETARREFKEELGIKIGKLTEIGEFDLVYKKFFHNHLFFENEYNKVYVCKISSDCIFTLQSEEVESVQWVHVQDLLEMLGEEKHCISDQAVNFLIKYLGLNDNMHNVK